MTGVSGSTDLQAWGSDPHGDQLERLRGLLDSVEYGAGTAELAQRVLAEAGSITEGRPGVQVIRDLLRLETRPSRYRRLLRIWVGKVSGAIRRGEFAEAGVWMKALTEAPIHSSELAEHMNDAVAELSRPDLFEELVLRLAAAGDPHNARELLAAWGKPLIDYLIEGMVVDEPPVNRRHLVEYLGMAGTGHLDLLLGWLEDSRWFIVRNVATSAGKTGDRAAIPALEAVADHEDDRVRVEVLRALALLDPETAVERTLDAFSDPNTRVRQAAISLLRASASPEVIDGTYDLIQSGSVNAADARRLVEVLAERSSEKSREVLSALAARRFVVGSARAARDAARRALEEGGDDV